MRNPWRTIAFGFSSTAAAGVVIDGLPRRLVFTPDDQIIPPALPAAAATAVTTTYLQGKDAWFEFDYAQLLDHLVN